jgi:hypothetical protein
MIDVGSFPGRSILPECEPGALMDASKEVGPEVNAEITKNILLSHRRNGGQNRNRMVAIRSFQDVSKFKCFGTTVTFSFVRKLRAYSIRGILVTIQFRIFFLLTC